MKQQKEGVWNVTSLLAERIESFSNATKVGFLYFAVTEIYIAA